MSTDTHTDTQSETAPHDWVCDQCQHRNGENQWPCGYCQYPVKLIDGTPTNTDYDMSKDLLAGKRPWICSHCTHANDQELTKCDICKARRSFETITTRRVVLDKLFLKRSGNCVPVHAPEAELTEEQVLRLLSSVVKKKHDYQLTDVEEISMGSKVIVSKNKDVSGVVFRVWAPNADRVFVLGEWNEWDVVADPLNKESNSEYWQAFVPEARPGQKYKYLISYYEGETIRNVYRNDPRGEILRSNSTVIYDHSTFKWTDQHFHPTSINELILYELHVGTFMGDCCSKNKHKVKQIKTGTFKDLEKSLNHFVQLGVNGLALMPITQDLHTDTLNCWGYDPISLWAIHTDYGTPDDLKSLINSAHRVGISVFFDFVPNHVAFKSVLANFDGPQDIYFPTDDKKKLTEWGPRFDFAKPQVKSYIIDAVNNLFVNYHFDGIRVDSTVNIRNYAQGNTVIIDPDGWTFLQELNDYIHSHHPGKISIAEDLNDATGILNYGGTGFDLQWDGAFFGNVLQTIISASDQNRKMTQVVDAIMNAKLYSDAGGRVIYTESHDTVPKDRQGRIPAAVLRGYQDNWVPCEEVEKNFFSFKRTSLSFAVLMTSVGVPMMLQGQELFETCCPPWPVGPVVDKSRLERKAGNGFFRLTQALCGLRRNTDNISAGLTGKFTRAFHINNILHRVVAYHRWAMGGPGDDVIIIANFTNTQFSNYTIGLPRAGSWKLRFNTDDPQYSNHVTGLPAKAAVEATHSPRDGYAFSASFSFAAYSVLIYSQDPMATVSIKASFETRYGDRLAIVGSSPQMGSWNVTKAVVMNTGYADITYPAWKTTRIPVNVGKMERFKVVLLRKEENGGVYIKSIGETFTAYWQKGEDSQFRALKTGTDYEYNCGTVEFDV